MKLKLSEIKPLVFELELPDGTVRSFDPLEVGAKVQRELAQSDGMLDTATDIIRAALGFPTAKEVAAAQQAPPHFTLSASQCAEIQKQLLSMIEEATAPKKP